MESWTDGKCEQQILSLGESYRVKGVKLTSSSLAISLERAHRGVAVGPALASTGSQLIGKER